MAGDWIKMRLNLVTHPKVMRLAECLLDSKEYTDWAALSYGIPGYPPPADALAKRERYEALRVTRYVTVCALLRFWGYANEHVEQDETVFGLWPDDVDEIVGVPSFSDALVSVGWIQFDSDTGVATLPNFHKYNAPSGTRGKTNAERQKAFRERQKASNSNGNSNGKSNITNNAREEKRREELNTSTASPLPDWIPEDAWNSYVEMRKKVRKPMTGKAVDLAVAELEKLREQGSDPRAVLDQSVLNSWQGLFPLKAGHAERKRQVSL